MTFKEYIEEIGNTCEICCIEGYYKGRNTGNHSSFAFEMDENENTTDTFLLMGDGYERAICIDGNQEISLKDSAVSVVTSHNAQIELVFRTSTIIPHPSKAYLSFAL